MFIFLTKKIAIPNAIHLRCVSWNQNQGYIACGGEGGLLKVLKLESPRRSDDDANKPPQSAVAAISWNVPYRKMSSSDDQGHIIVWVLHKGMWYEEMVNNRSKSVVNDLKWTPDGNRICIVYADGMVIVGSVDGGRLWGKSLGEPLRFAEWSPDNKSIVFVTDVGIPVLYDHTGNRLTALRLAAVNPKDHVRCIGIHWYNGCQGLLEPNVPTLAIAFANGRVQIARNEIDDNPVLIDTGMKLTHCQWNNNGTLLALAGIETTEVEGKPKESTKIQFYTPYGMNRRSLKVPGGPLEGIAWEGNGLRIAMAVGSHIFFASVRPDYRWGYFSNTLVYSYTRPDREDNSVMFYNVISHEKYIKYANRLIDIKAYGDHCVLVTKAEDSNQHIVILCNAIGSPLENRYIDITPDHLFMNKQFIIVASSTMIYVWQFTSTMAKFADLNPSLGKEGKETTFHIDETFGATTTDHISCISASNNLLVVGRESGIIQCYSLPNIHLEKKVQVKCRPDKIAINSNSTMISIIDINGTLNFFSFKQTDGEHPNGMILSYEKKDTWDMIWADDNPDLFAVMEKNRLYIMRGTEPEEPILCNGYLAEFKDLEIRSFNLDEIMEKPDEPKSSCMINFETISLRDARAMINTISLNDAYQYVQDHSHPRLWRLLAEYALSQLDFLVADKAFVQCEDYQGIQFVKRLKAITDKQKQKAEVAVYFQRFDEAESIYKEIDRLDLAIDLRMKLGDWFCVIQLLQSSDTPNEEMLNLAYNKIGDYYAERQQWKYSVGYYAQARNIEALINAYYILEEYEALARLLDEVPDSSPLLNDLAQKFQSVGMTESAVKAYLKMGDIKGSIDCCVLLNQWDKAVNLAEQYQYPQIEGLLGKYSAHILEENTTESKFAAIELYRKAGKATEAASILSELADQSGKLKVNPLRCKQLYVLSGLIMEEYKNKTLDTTMTSTLDTATATAVTLDQLMTQDSATSGNKLLEKHWRGAEAYHLYLLCHRHLYENKMMDAMIVANRLSGYEDIIDPEDIYSLLAYTAYQSKNYRLCSQAFMNLESLPNITNEERKKYESVAVKIFTKHNYNDKEDKKMECPKKCGEFLYRWSTECIKCGAKVAWSVASGLPITNDSFYRCSRCKHKTEKIEVRDTQYCPLCHGPLDKSRM